ncbi:MAG: LamG-like jellyroll fold domain-containing protein [Candidatus Komeilibacteria bacterium]
MFKITQQLRGFSLIEVIVAMGIFSMMVATIASVTGMTYLSEYQASNKTAAQGYANAGLEAVKAIRDRGWSELLIGQHGLDSSAGYWQWSGDSDSWDKYTRQIMIGEVYRDASGNIVDSGGSLDQHTKLVEVLVTWPVGTAGDDSLYLSTYFTNWASKDWQQTNWSGGPGQDSWLNDDQFSNADDTVDFSEAGEIKLKQAGSNPSPYVLLAHLDGPRYADAAAINNGSFSDYTGEAPSVDWSNWSEDIFGTDFSVTNGPNDSQAARLDYQWPLALGTLSQGNIAVTGDTSYQLSFMARGNVDSASLLLRDEDYYYLRSDGDWSWWINTVAIDINSDWTQFTINFTTRSQAQNLYISLNGWAFDWNQYLELDEIVLSREVVYDNSSYDNNGYRQPDDDDGPDYVSSLYDQGLSFDGAAGASNGDYVRIPASDSLNISSVITLEAWIKPSRLGGGNYLPIISKWSWNNGDNRSYQLSINPSKKLEFSISSDGLAGNGHVYSVTSSGSVAVDQWQQVVGVYDGSYLKVYIDGQGVGSIEYSDGIFVSGDQADVLLGSLDDNLHDDYRFAGDMDEVSIENIALSDTAVLEHYNNSPLTPESVIAWTAPEPVGVFIADKKVAGMNITGDYLYVALLDKKRVEVFDLSSHSSNPPSLGTFITINKSEDVAVSDDYIYVLTDVADPTVEIYNWPNSEGELDDISLVGTITADGMANGLWIHNNTLWLARPDNKVVVYDLSSDPTDPTVLGDWVIADSATDIAVKNDYAYVTLIDAEQAMQTFSLLPDPVNPSATDLLSALDDPIGVTVRDGYLFVTTGGSSRRVLAYDIDTNPAVPAPLGDFSIIDNGWDIATRGSYLYIGLGGSTKGIQVFDMTFMLAGGSGDTNYEVYGSLISSAFPTSSASGFNFISWDESLPNAEDDIKVQIRTATSLANLNDALWSGPAGPDSFYTQGNETIIPAIVGHNGDSWVQYLVHLYGSGDSSPILTNIDINYSP